MASTQFTNAEANHGPAPTSSRLQWRRYVWRSTQLLALLGGAIALGYWLYFAPIAVHVHAAARGRIVAEVMGTGTLEPHFSATISPKISGLITEVTVDQGERVERGQVLIRLHDVDLQRQVEVANGTLAAAQAAVARQQAERASALAVLEKAGYDLERIRGLIEHDTAASVEFQEVTKAFRVAEAEVARAEAALTEARKQVIAAEKTLEFQKARLADAVVSAPFDGLVARRDRDPGDVIVPGSSVLLLVATDEMWISAWVDETEMARLAVGQPARVVFRSEPQRDYPGEVARLGREVDRETREFVVDVHVRELPANWAVGQRAEVYIETGRTADALCLPARLIVWRDGKVGTLVDAGGRAEWRVLQLGLRGRELVEVVRGLSVDDRVIAPANPKIGGLKPGQRVTPAAESSRDATAGRK